MAASHYKPSNGFLAQVGQIISPASWLISQINVPHYPLGAILGSE
jgi:hypothetical protein